MKSDYYNIEITPNEKEYNDAIRLYKIRMMQKKRFAFYDFEHGTDWGRRSDVPYVNKKWESFLHEYPEYKIHTNPQNYIYEMYHNFDIKFTMDTAGLKINLQSGMFNMMFSLYDLDVENAIPLLQALKKIDIDKLESKVRQADDNIEREKSLQADACEEITT